MEEGLVLESAGRCLVGILHRPVNGTARVGVIVLVGGPQYRVGSHRQFVLLARTLCERGIAVLRFDFTGMGDSDGPVVSFEDVGDDVRAAVDAMLAKCPEVEGVCLWGLCDGASAALMYASCDPRVIRLVLLNPWVRTSEGQAQAYLKNYYGRRLRNPETWRKFACDPIALCRAALGWLRNVTSARQPVPQDQRGYLTRMLDGAREFGGKTLVLLSGQDLVATEFELLLAQSDPWQRAFASDRVRTAKLTGANHTFSRPEWSRWVEQETARFLSEDASARPFERIA